MKNKLSIIFIFFALSFCKVDKMQTQSYQVITGRDTILAEIENEFNNLFKLWYPLSVDTQFGGFYSDINYKWEVEGEQTKMIVTQARHVWSASNAAIFFNKDDSLIKIANHGFQFLKNFMWDKEFGGFYNLVERNGKAISENGEIVKQAYGNAFAIYGLAAYYKASGDKAALNLAVETFNWLDKNSYDPEYGGYFQFISREGVPYREGYGGVPPKDQNSSIHILECFFELYDVWPDKLLKERLTSLLHIIRDIMVTDKGYLNLFFHRNLSPVTFRDSDITQIKANYEFDHVSFGHDIETGYLLLEASHILGIENDTATLHTAKKMVDHTLTNGWDEKNGGIYDRGYYFKGENEIKIVKNTKEWWVQIEALNSCLMMSDIFKDYKSMSDSYYNMFCKEWNYIKNYLIDHKHGGFYWGGIDMVHENKSVPKATIWKGNYHTSRGLINCIRRLRKEG